MSLIEHHRAAIEMIDRMDRYVRPANPDQVGLLELWLDVFDAHLIDTDVLDYPGAEERADAAIQAGSLAGVRNAWNLAPPKRTARHHLLMEQQRRKKRGMRELHEALADDYLRKAEYYAKEGRP